MGRLSKIGGAVALFAICSFLLGASPGHAALRATLTTGEALADAFVRTGGTAVEPTATDAYTGPYASFSGLYPALVPSFLTLDT